MKDLTFYQRGRRYGYTSCFLWPENIALSQIWIRTRNLSICSRTRYHWTNATRLASAYLYTPTQPRIHLEIRLVIEILFFSPYPRIRLSNVFSINMYSIKPSTGYIAKIYAKGLANKFYLIVKEKKKEMHIRYFVQLKLLSHIVAWVYLKWIVTKT